MKRSAAMKRISTIISIVAASLLISAMPILAADESMGREAQRDECLLVAKNCINSVDSIQQRIEKLNKEIGNGTAVYTNEELRVLNKKLEDAEKLLDGIMEGGS
jgi:TolA-binding protein